MPGHNEVDPVKPTLDFGKVQVDSASLTEVCRRYSVKEFSLFGSAARGEMRPDSDVDIIVEFEPGARVGLIKFESPAEELEVLAGHRVDLVTSIKLRVCATGQTPVTGIFRFTNNNLASEPTTHEVHSRRNGLP